MKFQAFLILFVIIVLGLVVGFALYRVIEPALFKKA